jgi:hypothetical protein
MAAKKKGGRGKVAKKAIKGSRKVARGSKSGG